MIAMKGTCHDDPWVSTDRITTDDEGDKTVALHKNIFEDIRIQEDAAKQLTSINALLIGGYLAILMNTQSLGMMRDVLVYISYPKYFAYVPIIPVIFWFISIISCLKIIKKEPEKAFLKSRSEIHTNDLVNTLKDKCDFLKFGYLATIFGLFFILLIIIITIPNQLNGFSVMWNERGLDLVSEGKYEESITAFENAINLNPRYVDAWLNKGMALFELYRFRDSLQAFEKAEAIDPDYAETWYLRGIVNANLNESGEALSSFNNAIAKNNLHSMAWNSKGILLSMIGEYDQSLDAFNKSIEINPCFENAWNNKGVIYLLKGQYDEASRLFEHAIRLNPNNYAANQNIEFLLKLQDLRNGTSLIKFEYLNDYQPKCDKYLSLLIIYPKRPTNLSTSTFTPVVTGTPTPTATYTSAKYTPTATYTSAAKYSILTGLSGYCS